MAGSEEIHNYLEVAKKLALECGEIFESALALGKRVDTKSSDYDLVTEYDRAIEALLIEGLSSKFPEHKFIAEESTAAANEMSALTDSPTWLIDPIDGTTNFVHGFSQCCISMGLTVKKRLVLGLIYNPSSNEMFTAIRGEGAFLNGKRMNTSKITELNKSLVYIEPMGIRQSGKNRDIAVARFEAFVCSTQGTSGSVRKVQSTKNTSTYNCQGNVGLRQSGLNPMEGRRACILATLGQFQRWNCDIELS
ncbi:inositol monophosphatase 2-like isoform X3 [Venturia canescens]|uniref:inositol monophosphatase 2-like isoform X3 n=1 Tax=Venturia canescens TaxID=32260 RepID=UPI001C9BF243|nr:inositol monophosphatase 2-like isoform X3 [Venturia canescens]